MAAESPACAQAGKEILSDQPGAYQLDAAPTDPDTTKSAQQLERPPTEPDDSRCADLELNASNSPDECPPSRNTDQVGEGGCVATGDVKPPTAREEPRKATKETRPSLSPQGASSCSPKSVRVASEADITQIISTLAYFNEGSAKHIQQGCGEKALEYMNKAIEVCESRQNLHPAIAVETARVRLNQAAAFSACGSHRKAAAAINEAKSAVSGVLAWVADCTDERDPGVAAIAAEAKTLQCAIIVAEGIELEVASSSGLDPMKQPVGSRKEPWQLYEEAISLNEAEMMSLHPLTSLAQRFRQEQVPVVPTKNISSRKEKNSCPSLPAVGNNNERNSSLQVAQSLINQNAGPTEWPTLEGQPAGDFDEQPPPKRKSRRASIAAEEVQPEPVRKNTKNAPSPPRRVVPVSEKKDIFAQFLKDSEVERDLKRANNDTWQEDARKRLNNIHKTTKLMLELSEDDELKDKKYTYNGHKVMMDAFMKENHCRNDRQLVREARRSGASPEVYQVKKYNKELYVKPPTPPPPPPPPKPKLDDGLASLMSRPIKAYDPFTSST